MGDWSPCEDLNPGHPGPKPGALSTELQRRCGSLKRAPWLADQGSNLEPPESESGVLPIAPSTKKALVKRYITANHGGLVTCAGEVDHSSYLPPVTRAGREEQMSRQHPGKRHVTGESLPCSRGRGRTCDILRVGEALYH